jgi:peptide deformylase
MREVVIYGNEVLHTPTNEVNEFGEDLKKLIDEMYEIMYQSNGVGLSANQIGIPSRLSVVDVSPAGHEGKIVLVNPKIKSHSKKLMIDDEGCLSVPGIYLPILRYYSISVEYQDVEGKKHIINADGYFARAIQHEIDHLDGILFVERFFEHFDIDKILEENNTEEAKKLIENAKEIYDKVKKIKNTKNEKEFNRL